MAVVIKNEHVKDDIVASNHPNAIESELGNLAVGWAGNWIPQILDVNGINIPSQRTLLAKASSNTAYYANFLAVSAFNATSGTINLITPEFGDINAYQPDLKLGFKGRFIMPFTNLSTVSITVSGSTPSGVASFANNIPVYIEKNGVPTLLNTVELVSGEFVEFYYAQIGSPATDIFVVKKMIKATLAQAIAGTDDNQHITSKVLNDFVNQKFNDTANISYGNNGYFFQMFQGIAANNSLITLPVPYTTTFNWVSVSCSNYSNPRIANASVIGSLSQFRASGFISNTGAFSGGETVYFLTYGK